MLVNLIFASELPHSSSGTLKSVKRLSHLLSKAAHYSRKNQIPVFFQLTIKRKLLYLIKFNLTLISPPYFKNMYHFWIHMTCLLFPYPNQQTYPLLRFQKTTVIFCIFFGQKHISYLHSILLPFLVTVNTLHFQIPDNWKPRNKQLNCISFMNIRFHKA